MKKYAFLAATLLALPTFALAQSTAVPGFISYQGRVLNAAGTNVGSGTPVNRTVIFRIWDNPSSTNTANLIYSESQTVTVSEGEFSVLVGQGVANLTQTFGYNETAKKLADLATAFNGSTRYLGVTVAATGTIATTDNEINPRQQIVSTAFAMRSKVAETLNGGTITGTIAAAGSTFTGGTFTGGTLTGGTFTGGTFSGTGSNLTALNATSLSSGTVNDARLSSNVALLNRSPQTFTGATNIFNGNVGIGTATPQTQLHVNGGDLRVDSGSNVAGAGGAINFGYADTGTIPPMAMVKGLLSNSRGDGLQGGLAFYIRPYATTATNLTECLRISDSGNIGIGTTNPTTAKLVISGGAGAEGLDLATADQYANLRVLRNSRNSADKDMYIGFGSGETSSLHLYSNNAETITVKANKVGIGTTTPTKAKLEVSGSVTDPNLNLNGGLYFGPPTASLQTAFSNNGVNPVAIYANGWIVGSLILAFSDERIKHVEGRSDATQDLATLLGIQVTDYTYVDTIAKGAAKQKKVIAQQVEKVYPQAVSKSTDVVPDIYQKATQQDGWVQLATDLKVGDRVRLIGEKEEGIHEVLEVRKDAFRTAFKPATEKVFVYGREVKDFRSVDYEALSMLNVSATQELARQLEQQKAENAELKARLAEQAKDLATQEKRLSALDAAELANAAKLAAIEKLLQGADRPVLRNVSLKTAE